MDQVEHHYLEDKVLVLIRNNTSSAAPMYTKNIAPGQTLAPGLGGSNQSTTSSSHRRSDSYPDLNNYERASQWGQDWNGGDADTSGSSDGEVARFAEGKGTKGKGGSFNGICCNCGMRGQTSTRTNVNFFVDPKRSETMTQHQIVWDHKTVRPGSRCQLQMQLLCGWWHSVEANAKSLHQEASERFSSLTDADINFFEKVKTDQCELQQHAWETLPKPLVFDSGAGETVKPADWLTNHPLTESERFKSQ